MDEAIESPNSVLLNNAFDGLVTASSDLQTLITKMFSEMKLRNTATRQIYDTRIKEAYEATEVAKADLLAVMFESQMIKLVEPKRDHFADSIIDAVVRHPRGR